MKIMYPSLNATLGAFPIGYMKSRTCPAIRAHPPELNGCGKLQIFILSGKKFENYSTHDFAQHFST